MTLSPIRRCRAARKVREDAQAALGSTHGARLAPNGVRTAPAAAAKAAPAAVGPPNSRRSVDGGHNALEVGSTLKFTSISVCWKAINYYVPVPKGLTGAAALNIMGADAAEDVRGKKRLLHDITGAILASDTRARGAQLHLCLRIPSGDQFDGYTPLYTAVLGCQHELLG